MNKIDHIGLFSGGKDSLTTCHYMWKKGKMNEVIYCHTGVGLNEEYVKETCKLYGWKLNIVKPAPYEYETFVQRYGFPRPTSHTWIMQRLKLNPIRKWWTTEKKIRDNDIVFISGIRLKESKRRAMNFGKEDKLEKLTGMKFNKPCINWSNEKVLKYIEKHNLKISPIYKTLGLGGDCLCGAFTKIEHSPILEQKYPELSERIKDLEKNCRGTWGQFMSVTACQGQRKLDSLVCTECMSKDDVEEK